MNTRMKAFAPICCLISVAAFGGDKDASKTSLRVHFVDMQSATATTRTTLGMGAATWWGPSKGSGHGNIEDAGSWRGFDYSFECAERPDVNTTYEGRWKKPETRLVIVMPEIGNPKKEKECELKTTLKDVVYGIDAGTKSLTLYSYEQFAKILAQRKSLEEDSNPTDVDPAHFPVSVTILEARWQEARVGAFGGVGRGTIQNGDAVEAFEFDCLCPFQLMPSLQGSGYPGRWLQEPTRLVILLHDMGVAQHARQCELNTSVHTDRAYVRNTEGVVVAITTEQYKRMYNIQAKTSPNGQNSQENTVQIPNSSKSLVPSALTMPPEQSPGAPFSGSLPTRIKQGGNVTAASIISQARPVYPPLARQARIQGNVVLHVIIDKDGNVEQIEVVSGHPLLVQAAVDAVRQWRYKQTLLNGTPVEVDTTITVTFTMGDLPVTSTEAPQDTPVQSLQDACDAGNVGRCVDLGVRYANGQGATKDESRAVQLFQKGCDGGNAAGCSNLGVMYGKGQGVTKDESRAAQLFQKGCDGGNAAGCNTLGFMYENGQVVPKDEGRAAQLYQKACAMGLAEACAKVKK